MESSKSDAFRLTSHLHFFILYILLLSVCILPTVPFVHVALSISITAAVIRDELFEAVARSKDLC